MTRRVQLRLFLALWIVLGISLLYLFLLFARSNAANNPPSEEISPQATSTEDVQFGDGLAEGPVKLIIPKLGINTSVQHVGLTASGNMGTPTGPYKWDEVAWYKLGPKPGDKGNAAIAGHVDDAKGNKAVFANLSMLNAGDEVQVLDERGKTLKFKVVKKSIYNYKNAPLEEIFGDSDKHRLNLITCAGDWVQSERSYTERLVVYTERIQ